MKDQNPDKENTFRITLLERAIAIALESHQGQIDKAGKAYILHPLRVMLAMKSEEEMIVAVLHDAVEDSNVTLEDLKLLDFSAEIIDAIACIAKKSGGPYFDYIQRIKKNSLASRVKIADLRDNMNLQRIPNPKQEDFDRVEKYKKALAILQDEE